MGQRARQAGYTFVEMIIAMAVAVIVGVGIYGILSYQRRAAESQRTRNELQTGCRFAMDQVKRELSLAGYRAQNTARPVSLADDHGMAFEYWDDRASTDAPFDDAHFDRHSLVSFRLDGGNLVRTLRRWDTLSNSFQPGSANMSEAAVRSDFAALNAPYRQTLATNVDGFELRYFNQDNELWDRNLDSLDEIRSVVVSLQCRSAEANPFIKNPDVGSAVDKFAVVRLQSHVRLRNVDISTNPRDTQPPGPPANVRAWDPGNCGTLALAWDANRESDLAGYTIYYGLATGSYSNRIRLARGPGAAGDRVNYTLAGMESTKTDCVAGTVTPVTYFMRVEAFDKSGNPSTRSAEISGNPSPSIRTDSMTDNDTTVNPAVPLTLTGLVAATPADNQVQLSWTSSPVVGLLGYRLYRGSVADFTPAGRRVGDPGSNIVADETTLTAAAIGHLDTGLTGCVPVYYKVAAIACDNCLPIAVQSFATISALPTDSGKPAAPKLVARAGFKRVILSLENPVRTEEPDFKETRVYFNAGSGTCTYPYFDTDGVLKDARLIPDNGGIFSGEGTLASVNFDDANIPDPSVPNLAIDSSYCFLAVSYDQCNNHSDAADDAKDVGQQCGDCLSGELCNGAPDAPAPTEITTAGCYGSLALSWPHLDPTGTAVRDFAGYRVYRCENSSASPCSSESKLGEDERWRLLTGPDPVWFSRFVDSPDKGLEEGRRYSYRVQATDCYWEQHHGETAPEGGWPEGNDPNDNASDSALLEALSTGRILRDPARPIVLAGMTPNADWTQYPISEGFQHHTVLLRLMNTADAQMTLKQATLEWESDAAFLQQVALGDNSTTPLTPEAWPPAPSTPLTQASGGVITFDPEGRVYLHGLDDAIPVHLTFKREDGGVTDSVNLRENQMQIGIGYRNDSTGDRSCTTLEKVQVPLGPYISGTTQNWPHLGTVASPVPGVGGQNPMNIILVPGEQSVDVHANVLDSDLVGIREVRLYYAVDSDRTHAAAPPLDAGSRYDGSLDSLPPYHGIEMEQVAGSQWRTPVGGGIPAHNDANVWYFIVAVDENGNFDREPEPGGGAFQYYQQPPDVCLDIPAAPVLTGSASSTSVTLSWTAPALNRNGSAFTDPGGFVVYRWSATRGPEKLRTLAGETSYIDPPPGMDTETYAYYVTALDSCPNPGANESAPSNWYTECQGAAGCTVRLATNQRDPSFFQAGDSFSMDLFVCEKIDGQAGENLFVQVCSGADANLVRLTESADTGTFRIDSGSEVTTWLAKPGGAGPLDLGVGADDTVTVHAWSSSAPSGGCGSLVQCAASLRVQADPCAAIPVPATPSLTVAVNGAPGTCGDTAVVDLVWTGPDPGAALFYRLYRCSNADNKADCVPVADGSKVLPIGAEPDRGQTGRSAADSPGVKADRNRIWYQVEAVSHNGCTNRSLWQTAISSAVADDCP